MVGSTCRPSPLTGSRVVPAEVAGEQVLTEAARPGARRPGAARPRRMRQTAAVLGSTSSSAVLAAPAAATPARRSGSVRRTSSTDLLRRQGAHGPLTVVGRARDLATDRIGTPRVVASALVNVTIADGVATAVSMHPQPDRAALLVGRRVGTGWRTGLYRYVRDHHDAGTPLHLLLDELPVGLIISAFTQRRMAPATGRGHARRLDVCAGWAAGGMAARAMHEHGMPPEPPGPLAPDLVDPEDPLGWHTLAALPTWGISRRRRIDVWPQGAALGVDAMFRDTYVDDAGRSRVLHEYAVAATVDPATHEVLAVAATAHAVPHPECPLSVASAQRIVGAPAGALRDRVSMDLFGPRSCTHLNDLLRSLADVPALAGHLGAPEPPRDSDARRH